MMATWTMMTSGEVGAQQADEELIDKAAGCSWKKPSRATAGPAPPAIRRRTTLRSTRSLSAALPGNDPLFVTGPSKPDLKDLEVKRLLQRFSLVLENLDGFDQPGVLRGVPHTLGLSQSLAPDQTLIDAGITHATGWSGDGSPGDGSLKNFALGAVIQHFTKTLNRVPGVDFRLPTEPELAALEAFQRSLGRQQEVNIDPADPAALVFTDAFVEDGKFLFDNAPSRNGNGRSCDACHNNAGANNASGVNRNFATGTMFLTNAPGCLLGFIASGDGGFGVEPVEERARVDLCGEDAPTEGPKATVRFQGDLTMNTPSLIEAADTPPFFHNNSAATIEDSVAFYTSDTFNNSLAGAGNAFVLTDEETNQIAALLRALNALENIRSSIAYSEQALRAAAGARRGVGRARVGRDHGRHRGADGRAGRAVRRYRYDPAARGGASTRTAGARAGPSGHPPAGRDRAETGRAGPDGQLTVVAIKPTAPSIGVGFR